MLRSRKSQAAALFVDNFFLVLSSAGRAIPTSRPRHHGIECISDVSYGPEGRANTLDIYRPAQASGPLPVVLYIHGGGFRSLSKDSHWLMGMAFARRGYLVLNINYRLAPKHPYPAAIEDCCSAWVWALDMAASYGGDPERMVIAGESAGANLTMALTVACCYSRPEPWAHAVYERGVVPRAVAPACGIFQVTEPSRFRSRGFRNRFSVAVIRNCEDCYLPTDAHRSAPALADPLCIIEQQAPTRPLPPAFLPVGGWDPLRADNARMAAALMAHGTEAVDRVYPREIHAFHAMVFRRRARQCWRDMLRFVEQHTSP